MILGVGQCLGCCKAEACEDPDDVVLAEKVLERRA